MIVRNPEDNENNREIKHILLSDLFASSGRVYHSNLRPRTIDVNDHQGNAFYPNDIYIHNIDGTSTTYILLSKTETTADWRYVGDLSCTFVIDTVDAMDKWSNNTADYDYTAVYIKSGTWTLPATRTINPSTVATKKVTGDPLSVPTINFSSQFIKSASEISNIKLNMTTPDAGLTELTAISNSENLDNVEIAWGIPDPSISVYGFSSCNKMKSCKVTGSAGSDFTAFWQCNGIDFTCESVIDYKECRFTYTKVIDPIKSVPTDNIIYTIKNYGKHLVHIPKLYTVSTGDGIYTLTIKSSSPGTSVAKTLIDNNDTDTDMEFEIYVDASGNVGKLGEDPSIIIRDEDFTLADSVPDTRVTLISTKEGGPIFITLPPGDTYYGATKIKLYYNEPIEIIRVGTEWISVGSSIDDEVVSTETTWSSYKIDKLTKEVRSSANFTLDTFTDGTRLRVINTHATNTITCTLPSGQTYNGAGTISIPAGRAIDIELIGTTWRDSLTGDLVGNADTASAIKPLGNSIKLPATPTSETKIIKIGTAGVTYKGSIIISCVGANIADGIKVCVDGETSLTGGIRVIYGKNNTTYGIKKIIVTRTTEIWNSSRNIYAEIVTSENNFSTTTLGVVETNRGTFTPSMTEVSSVEGTVLDSLSLDYLRGDISSYQHEFTKNIIGNLTGNADTANAIKPLGNSITLETTPTSVTKIIKIATVDYSYSGSINIGCYGNSVNEVIKVHINGGPSTTSSGIRVIYGKLSSGWGIKKIICTSATDAWDSNRNIYAEIKTFPNYILKITLGVVKTNKGTFTPSMTEVSSVEGTVLDSLSLDYLRGDISSYQHEFTKNIIGNLTGNADTATKLANARTITIAGDATGSTTFDGSANKTITLSVAKATNAATADKWKTARNITISDADGTNTGSAVSVDGSENKTLKLPATIKANITGKADTANAIKPLGNSIALPATPTSVTKIIKIATVDVTYNGSINITCAGAGIEDGIKVRINGGSSIYNGIRVIYGKNTTTYGIKKITVTRATEIWNSKRNIYAEIVNSPNAGSTTRLGVVETNRGTFTPSMTEVSSVEGTVLDSLSLDYFRGDISSYQHVFEKNIIGNLTGNADTATKLAAARKINGVSFDGSTDITVADSTKAPIASPALTGTPTINGETVWHSGNDGSGSGLDADLLDGLNSSDFPRKYTFSGAESSVDLNTITEVGFYNATDNAHNTTTFLNTPVVVGGGGFTLLVTRIGSNYVLQLFQPYGAGSPTLYKRSSYYSGSIVWSPWVKVWDSDNDGSGSGLDADLLDGQQGSYYAPKASPALTGNPTAPTQATGNNSTRIATTAFVNNEIANDRPYSDTNPLRDGTASQGSSARVSRQDHVHPTDTTRAPLDSPTFTGTVTAPLLGKTQIIGGSGAALTRGSGFLNIGNLDGGHLSIDQNEIQAKSNGTTPTKLYLNDYGGDVSIGNATSKVTAPTPATATNNTQIATTAFVKNQKYEPNRGTGTNSIALGTNSNASGGLSIALGIGSATSGDYSTALGTSSKASGDSSTAIGVWSTASGDGSIALGYNAVASRDYQITIGTKFVYLRFPSTETEATVYDALSPWVFPADGSRQGAMGTLLIKEVVCLHRKGSTIELYDNTNTSIKTIRAGNTTPIGSGLVICTVMH